MHIATQMILKCKMLHERSQVQKASFTLYSIYMTFWKSQNYSNREQTTGCWMPGTDAGGGFKFKGMALGNVLGWWNCSEFQMWWLHNSMCLSNSDFSIHNLNKFKKKLNIMHIHSSPWIVLKVYIYGTKLYIHYN